MVNENALRYIDSAFVDQVYYDPSLLTAEMIVGDYISDSRYIAAAFLALYLFSNTAYAAVENRTQPTIPEVCPAVQCDYSSEFPVGDPNGCVRCVPKSNGLIPGRYQDPGKRRDIAHLPTATPNSPKPKPVYRATPTPRARH